MITSLKKQTKFDECQLNQIIKQCWDKNVVIRALDLEQATDHSYVNIIKPWVIEKVIHHTNENSSILDIGCGCGYLTNSVYNSGRHKIIGIDISEKSIAYAQKRYPNISFLCKDICDLITEQTYDLCLAIMLLNNMPNINSFFSIITKLIDRGGRAIVVIPHPCFWPQSHLNNNNYCYSNEVLYDLQFATKGRSDYAAHIPYFHRMLETYLHYIYISGLRLTDFCELTENSSRLEPDILCMELISI